MSKNPQVSVIIVVKDGDRFLDSAIESVFQQTFTNYELIVIDGNSTDNTATIAKSYEQIRYFLQQSKGIAGAYNEGISNAKGELIAFLSHDDMWTPDKLETQVKYMEDNPEMEYTVARVKFFLETGHSAPSGFRSELLQGDHVGKIMETLVAKKTLFDKIGGLSSDFNVAEDVDWFARANDAKIPTGIVDRVLLNKRVHDTNLSLNAQENNQNLLTILRKSIERKRQQQK